MTAGNGPPPLGIVNSPGRVAGDALRVGTVTRVVDTPAPAAPTQIATTRIGSKMDLPSLSEMCDDAPSGVVLLNYLIRPQQQRRRDGETERFGGLEVDDELEFRRLLYRQIAWFGAFEDLVDIGRYTTGGGYGVRRIGNEPAHLREFGVAKNRR